MKRRMFAHTEHEAWSIEHGAWRKEEDQISKADRSQAQEKEDSILSLK
jgi:hypothetical protein